MVNVLYIYLVDLFARCRKGTDLKVLVPRLSPEEYRGFAFDYSVRVWVEWELWVGLPHGFLDDEGIRVECSAGFLPCACHIWKLPGPYAFLLTLKDAYIRSIRSSI